MKKIRMMCLLVMFGTQTACVGTIVGTAVDVTLEVAKVPFKVVGAAIDVIDGDDE